jgi:hypothetical protein
MERVEVTLYWAEGVGEWRRFPDLIRAMDWYASVLVHCDGLPLSALIRELCAGCGEWYDLGGHGCGEALDLAAWETWNGLRVVAGCDYAGRYGIHCEGLPAPANWNTGHGDSPDWSRVLCTAHAHAFGWEQLNARHT